jgi:hypothetical protein
MTTKHVIGWSTAGAVLGVAAVASYEHAYDLVRADGGSGCRACMVPLTVDGLINASSMVMLDSAPQDAGFPVAAMAPGLGHRGNAGGLLGAAVAAWSAMSDKPRLTGRKRICLGLDGSYQDGVPRHACGRLALRGPSRDVDVAFSTVRCEVSPPHGVPMQRAPLALREAGRTGRDVPSPAGVVAAEC